MLSLALAFVLSQTPPAVTPEVFQRFEAQRGPTLAALAKKYDCARPAKAAKPLCDIALSEEKGTAADIRGQNTLMGLTWLVKPGTAGKLDVSAPRLSALALNKDSVGVWGAITDITPQDAAEKRMLGRLTQDYVAL